VRSTTDMARLREGWANTVRGAAHFLTETIGRVRYSGAATSLRRQRVVRNALVAPGMRSDDRFRSPARNRVDANIATNVAAAAVESGAGTAC